MVADGAKEAIGRSYGDPAYHAAHEKVATGLLVGYKEWLKLNPQDSASNPFYAFTHDLFEGHANQSFISDVAHTNRNNLQRFWKSDLQKQKSVSSSSLKDKVSEKFPEYRKILAEIIKARSERRHADDLILKGEAFRRMGGLARIGTPEEVRYADLVKVAQDMEKMVLGKILTAYAGV